LVIAQRNISQKTSSHLVDTLREKGLTTRRTPGRAERDVSYTSLLSMLRNSYYMGVVTYQGVTYQGQHPALVSPETWLRVQDILGAHAHAGEKDRVHQHYLRGTIFCGGCGRRLIFSRHVGRGTYDYFLCPKRRTSTTRCPRRAIRIEAVEDGVTALYHHVQLSPAQIEQLRDSVRAELDSATTEAHRQAEQATRRLAALHDERTRLMQAHYAEAVPLDLLKTEMHRLTAAMQAAEQQTSAAQSHLADIEAVLEQALLVAGTCHRAYADAPALIKRQINQGFFIKLLIDQDGSVEWAELTEPFAQLLTSKWQTVTGGAQNTPDTTGSLPTPRKHRARRHRRPWAP